MGKLEAELGGPGPDGLAELTEEERDAFAAVVHNAKLRQSEELEVAIERSLRHLPRPLRATIRKILFG